MSDSIVFFGTGPVAAHSLKLLHQHAVIEAVITKPKPSHHKGDYPVLTVAEQLGIPVHTVLNKSGLDALINRNLFTSKLGVLIDFGIIVSKTAIDSFPLGILNSHFSLLPEWRGADPITFSILSGQSQTGISLMLLVEAMDEGPILTYVPFEIPENCTTPELTDALIVLSNEALRTTLPKYMAGQLQPTSQEKAALPQHSSVSYSHKLTKETGELDFTKPAAQLEREVRAYIEWPKSHTRLNGYDITVTKAHIADGFGEAGKLWRDRKEIGFYTTNGIFVIDSLKPAGKTEMSAEAFLAGYKV